MFGVLYNVRMCVLSLRVPSCGQITAEERTAELAATLCRKVRRVSCTFPKVWFQL